MAAAFSEKQVAKVFELRKKGWAAKKIADHINGMTSFENDPEMTASSVHGIVHRRNVKNKSKPQRNSNGNGTKSAPCYIKEYMVTLHEEAATMSFTLPRDKQHQVERQLGIK
jgi:hypothetical protein